MISDPTDTGQSKQLHATHLAVFPKLAQSLSEEQVQPSFKHGSEGNNFESPSKSAIQTF